MVSNDGFNVSQKRVILCNQIARCRKSGLK